MSEKKRKINVKIWICAIFILFVALIAVGGYGGYRLKKHEEYQREMIQNLQDRVNRLSAKIDSLSVEDINWLSKGYNYLAIGNSITVHGVTSYWWNEIGMAASDENHDYYHIVKNHLEEKYDSVMSEPFNFSVWENQSHDRDETLVYLDQYLSPELDLITIQLAENASILTTYEDDYVSLLKYVKEKAPNARILVIGDFWKYQNRSELKERAVIRANAEYVSLDGITDNEDYYCGKGAIVYDKDGNEHIVEHGGVAIHPGDKGMEAIAERIINKLDE